MSPNWHLYWWKAAPRKLLRTCEEWQEYMRPLMFVNGSAANDILWSEQGPPRAVWATHETAVSPEDHLVIIAARDPRFEYDMNRSIIGVKPEYFGEPETWI